jgi:hypothetical protein
VSVHSVRRTVLLAVVLVVAGCDGGPAPSPLGAPVTVKGKVTLNGAPLTKGTVAFFPVEPGKGDESFGVLGPGGEFTTTVFPGKYRVAVEPDYVRAGTPPKTSNIPAKYQKPGGSGLEIDVPTGGRTDANFDIR